jgi:hypothetical protein
VRLRLATAADIPELLSIKRKLAFGGPGRGGFLLGCDVEGYRQRLASGRIWLLEAQELLGFAVTLPPDALRASPLWGLRDNIEWTQDAPTKLDAVGYYDQLAVLPPARQRAGLWLALVALRDLLAQCSYVVTTTVSEPVQNLAAVPLIRRVGGVRVGRLEESYPELGALTSEIWLLDAEQVRTRLKADRPLERWLAASPSPAEAFSAAPGALFTC